MITQAPTVFSRSKRLTHDEVDEIAQRLKKQGGHVTFYLSTTGSFSLRGYTDLMGRQVIFETRKRGGGRGDLKATVFRSNGQEFGPVKFVSRRLSIPAEDIDIVKAVMCHPECKGSPNSRGQSTFHLHDPASEKETRLKEVRAAKEASDIAFGLTGFELALAAARVGSHTKDKEDQLLAVIQHAESRPLEFHSWFAKGPKGFTMVEGEYLSAMVTMAIRDGIITRKTREDLFHFGDLVVGDSHNTIVNRLAKQTDLRDEIEAEVKQRLGFGGPAKAVAKK